MKGKAKGKEKRLALSGAFTGAANGLLGGGGGMLAVPALQRAGYPEREAHATAIAVILPASLVSGAVYLAYGAAPPALLVPVALGVCAGGAAGAGLLSRLSSKWVSAIFALVMLAAGLWMAL